MAILDTASYCAGIRVLIATVAVALYACAAPPPTGITRSQGSGPLVAVFLVAHDGHTGIALRRAEIPEDLWPETRDFPQAEYFEVGWGNRDYYYGRNQGFWGTLGAILPSPSVVHVAGFRGAPADYFRANEIVELALPREDFVRLVRYIHDAFERSAASGAVALGAGLYGDSRFYPGWESFHLLRTCNVWTARGLRAAGLPIRDSITMESLMSQAREMGRPLRQPQR